MARHIPLEQKHQDLGGKMVEYGGYIMPVQYTAGVIKEHLAVRQAAGLFDVSHMGEVLVWGPGAEAYLDKLLTNDMTGMPRGSCRYSPMCNERGGVVDDLIVYRKGPEDYMVVVNAANRDKDVEWMKKWLPEGLGFADVSDETALLALQGPKAPEILAGLTEGGAGVLPEKSYTFADGLKVAGVECLVSRTGYTGEDGFELYCAPAGVPALWDAIMAAGQLHGLLPCGLGARDTLRLEAAMPLYGHEMDEEITPLEAGLGFFVKMDAGDFIGRQALAEKGPPAKRRTGLRITGRGIAREGDAVYLDGRQVGRVTSGTQLPFVGWPGAMALLEADARQPGTALEVEVRGRRVEAEVVKLPFYKRG